MFPDHKEATAQIPVVGLTGTGTLFHVPTTGTTNRKWWTATGGLEVSAPSIHRVVPFVRIGGGYVHHSYDYTRPEFRFPIGTIFPGYDFNRTDVGYIPTVNFGAGLRWYHSERRGVRILVDGFRLSRSVEDIAVPESRSNVGYLFVNSRGGGRITIGYFIHF
jgi:hypothetical protein